MNQTFFEWFFMRCKALGGKGLRVDSSLTKYLFFGPVKGFLGEPNRAKVEGKTKAKDGPLPPNGTAKKSLTAKEIDAVTVWDCDPTPDCHGGKGRKGKQSA